MKVGKIIVIVVLVLAVFVAIFFQTETGKGMILQYQSYRATRDLLDPDNYEEVEEVDENGDVQISIQKKD